MIAWIKQKPENAARLYRGLPKTVVPSEGGAITARFIQEFGADQQMTGALYQHFLYEDSWMGSQSAMARGKRDEARKWLELALAPAVRNWVISWISMLSNEIGVAELNEERETL